MLSPLPLNVKLEEVNAPVVIAVVITVFKTSSAVIVSNFLSFNDVL